MPTLFGQRIEPDFDPAKEQRNERGKRAFWIGLVILFVYGFFRTVTVEVFQAYMATFAFYGLLFYVKWGDHLRKRWLWNAIIASVPIHAIYLGVLFRSDVAFPEWMTKPIVFGPVLILGCAVEAALIDGLVGRFKPRGADRLPDPTEK